MVAPITISGRKVGPGERCFVIAEAGVNHNGELSLARELIDAAKAAGADAVKFQTFRAERLVTRRAPTAAYQAHATGGEQTQFEMLKRLELSPEAHRELFAYCRARQVLFLSTPFDEEAVDRLVTLGVPALKLPSGEVTNLPLLGHAARTRLPLIVSTGMSSLDEVADAVRTIRASGGRELALLHCVSSYPADPTEANLRAMDTMRSAFGVAVGYSDHTLGIEVALAAVALGACIIEKHVTMSRSLPGPDHQASATPEELAALIKGIRAVEVSLGHGRKEPAASEAGTAAVARKSLVAAQDIPVGSRLTEAHVAAKRPGTGLPPSKLREVVGRVAARDIAADTVLTREMLQ